MAANTSPIFLKQPSVQWVSTGTSANTNLDGTGTVATLFTADATNGSKVEKVIMEALGTNVATVVRIFMNNGSTNATAANNTLIYEEAIAANTLSQTAVSIRHEILLDVALPAAYKLTCTTGTAIAAGVQCTAVGGHY
jgi:7-cyano-7-deazaguanine synthase in queuosine biosynthesis